MPDKRGIWRNFQHYACQHMGLPLTTLRGYVNDCNLEHICLFTDLSAMIPYNNLSHFPWRRDLQHLSFNGSNMVCFVVRVSQFYTPVVRSQTVWGQSRREWPRRVRQHLHQAAPEWTAPVPWRVAALGSHSAGESPYQGRWLCCRQSALCESCSGQVCGPVPPSWAEGICMLTCALKHKYSHIKPLRHIAVFWGWNYELETFLIRTCYAFAKLRKVTVRCVTSVRMEERASCWTDFWDILYFEVLLKSVTKIQVWLKSGRSRKELYMKTYIHLTTVVSNVTIATLVTMVTSLLFLDF